MRVSRVALYVRWMIVALTVLLSFSAQAHVGLLAMLTMRGRQAPTIHGLTAEYFQNEDLTGHRTTRTDAQLDGYELPPATIDANQGFSVRWSGHLNDGVGGHRTFFVTASPGDSARIWTYVDGVLVVYEDTENEGDSWGHTFYETSAGVDVVVLAEYDYYDGFGLVELDEDDVVPSSHLTPAVVTQAPTVTVAHGSTFVSLSWAVDPNATGYNVYRSTTSGGTVAATPLNTSPITGSGTITYTDQTVASGTTYYYTVKAIYANAMTGTDTLSSPSAQVSGMKGGPLVPTDLQPNPPLGILPDALTLSDWLEGTVPSDESDAPGGGPASAISVSLPHGVVDVDEGPDLTLDDPTGPGVVFERRYRTALAAANLSSPGLPRGWTHNWDYRIVPLQQGAWGPLKLVYPNGASDTITPVLSGGIPTGKFTVPSGAPYVAIGYKGSNFTWDDIVLQENGLALQDFESYSGESVYRLASQEFDNGDYVYLDYAGGKLTNLVDDSYGMELDLAYGASGGLLSAVTDAVTGKSRTFSYSSGALTGVSHVSDSSGEWAYGYTTISGAPYLNAVGTMDPHGNVAAATVNYNGGTGRANSVTDAKGDVRSYSYSDTGSATVSLAGASGAPDGYTAAWDSNKRQTSVANAAGDVTTYAYDTVDPSQVVTITPPLGSATSVQTDSHGNPIRVTYPYGNYDVYTWEYPTNAPLGRVRLVEEFGSNGISKGTTTYAYYLPTESNGKSNYLKSVQRPLGGTWTYTYTSLGNVAQVSAPASTTSYAYTATGVTERYGKPLSVNDGMGHLVRLQYDAAGRVTGVQDPVGNVATAAYNVYDQPTAVQMPLGRSLQIGYAVAGKAPTATAVSAGGSSLTLEQASYDKESGLAATTDANNLTTSVSRDGHFDLQSVTNGSNHAMHGFLPDPIHRAGQATMGTGSRALTLNATMNANGDVTSVTGSDARTTQVFRVQSDPSLVSSLRWTDGSGNQKRVDYTYDVYGRMVQAGMDFAFDPGSQSQQPTYKRVYTYDAEDHLLTAGIPGATEVEYAYNLDGTRSAMYVVVNSGTSRPAGTRFAKYSYGYAAARRLTSIAVNYADSGHNVLSTTVLASATYAYDADGRVIAVRTPKATTVYAYDALGRLTALQNLTPDGTVDPNAPSGAQVTDPYNGTAHSILSAFSSLAYDIRGDQTGMQFSAMAYSNGVATFGSGGAAWGYDAAGRLTSESWTGGVSFTSIYAYDGGDNLTGLRGNGLGVDAASDQLSGSAYAFNASGDQTGFAGGTLGYDQRGFLTSAVGNSIYGTNETYTYAPSYDEQGRRRVQTLSTYASGVNGVWTQTFVYDGDALVLRTNSALSTTQNNASDLSNDPSVLYLWGPTGPVMEFDLSGHAKALTFDPQGNCLSTTDSTVVQPVFYDAYGKPINSYAGDDRVRQQPLQYKGQAGYFTDAYSGLDYCLHRYYDPNTGRWTQRDPIGLEGGINVYAYCAGNPVMYADPSGLQQFQMSFEELMQNAFGLHTQADINHFYGGLARGFAEKASGTPMGAAVGVGYYGYKKDYYGMLMSLGSLGLNIGFSSLDSEVDPVWRVTDGLAT